MKLRGFKPKYSAQSLLALLESRHIKDVFISECKDGPTHYSTHLRMDAWVMNKSWAHPCATGYEIKVSRADFIGDNKWPAYLPLCNQFYFVTPPGLIDLSELSPDAGLMVAAGEGTGTRLVMKKKAPYRQVEIPEEVYRYILMCRVKVESEGPMFTVEQTWRKWLERKQENRRLGYEVSKAIRERAEEIENENVRLKNKMSSYDRLATVMESLGISVESWQAERDLRDKIEAHEKVFNPVLVGKLRAAERVLADLVATVEAYNAPKNGNGSIQPEVALDSERGKAEGFAA